MKTPITIAIAATFATSMLAAPAASALELAGLQKAVTDGTTDISLRYRYERVDQDNLDIRFRRSKEEPLTKKELDKISSLSSDFHSTGHFKIYCVQFYSFLFVR